MFTESALNHCAAARRIVVAYSGGVDSHVLLHRCASIAALKPKITAVYVHHGLQAAAESWAEHCAQVAHELGVEFVLLRVNAAAHTGESPEEAARNARYTALKSLVTAEDVLLIAQHREDQLETVLLQLFRGGGLRGLSGMPESMAFGLGLMLRPLLNVEKAAINEYAHTHQLRWIEDPSNQATDYDRNFLRNTIVPLLKQRWPALDKTVARSANHCAEAQRVVSACADELFLSVFNSVDNTLHLTALNTHSPPQQHLIIRQWFQRLGLKMPALGVVERILAEVVGARTGSDPLLSGRNYQIRRYRDKLYCLPPAEVTAPLLSCVWSPEQNFITLPAQQTLCCLPASTGILREQWQNAVVSIRARRGGERISLPHREGYHSLKKLFQERGIPPWEREYIPLVYLNDELAAIGTLWISAAFYAEKEGMCISLARKSALDLSAE